MTLKWHTDSKTGIASKATRGSAIVRCDEEKSARVTFCWKEAGTYLSRSTTELLWSVGFPTGY